MLIHHEAAKSRGHRDQASVLIQIQLSHGNSASQESTRVFPTLSQVIDPHNYWRIQSEEMVSMLEKKQFSIHSGKLLRT